MALKLKPDQQWLNLAGLRSVLAGSWPIFAATVFLLALISLGILDHKELIDEPFYIPIARKYAEAGFLEPILGSLKAVSTVGPSYYISLKFWTELFGNKTEQFRLFSTCCMIAASGLWYLIGRRFALKMTGANMLTLFVMPHLAITSFCVMAESFTLFNMLLFLFLWITATDRLEAGDEAGARNFFLGCGLPLAMAANAKPPCIVYAAAFTLIGLIRLRNKWATAGPLLAILLQLPFWLMWGSIFPPAALTLADHSRQAFVYPDTTIHLLTIAGLMLWPALNLKWNLQTVLQIVTGAVVWMIFEPDLSPGGPQFYRFLGPLMQASSLVPAIKWLYLIAFLVAWKLLWDLLIEMLNQRLDIIQQALLAGVFLFFIGIMKSPLAFDRYAAFFLPYLYLVVAKMQENRPVARGICLCGWFALTVFMLANIR